MQLAFKEAVWEVQCDTLALVKVPRWGRRSSAVNTLASSTYITGQSPETVLIFMHLSAEPATLSSSLF